MNLPELATERLRLVAVHPDHAPHLHPALSDADALRHWADPPSADEQLTRDQLAEMASSEHGGWWSLIPHEVGHPVGYVGFLSGVDRPGQRAGFGYVLDRRWWGRGMAHEAAAAAVDHGFGACGMDSIEMWVHRENHRSRALAERLGATPRAELMASYRAGAHPTVVYGISAAEHRGELDPADVEQRVYGVEPTLPVTDVAAAVRFFTDVLGFEVDFTYGDGPAHAAVRSGRWSQAEAYIHLSRCPEPPTPCGWLYVRVGSGIAEMMDALRARGAHVDGPVLQPWGMQEAMVQGPEGHLLCFTSPPGI